MPSSEGERRQLTVLFCDLVGSTELAGRMDPEEWRRVVQAYQTVASQVVERYGGHVAQLLGDGILAYFGWPQAYGDDAERAVRAGLGLVHGVPAHDPHLVVRVGIHTGLVVIGPLGGARAETLAVGDTPNVAARVPSIAEPGAALMTAATHRLVSGLFLVEPRGPERLKGVAEPVALYRVLQASGVRSRLAAAAAARGLTPFVGRTQERALLRERVSRALRGEGQLVLIVGEPGIGKSRLAQSVRDDVVDVPHVWLETGAAPYFTNTPFYAVKELMRQGLSWRGDETDDERIAFLERVLPAMGLEVVETLPIVAPFLDVPLPPRYTAPLAAPEVLRKRLFQVLIAWVRGAARRQPVVIVLEDLQWVDPSTLEYYTAMVEQAATAPILLVCTARPEFRAPWPLRAHHTQLMLNRLPAHEASEIVRELAARAVSGKVVDTVVHRADGVPLFLEELTRAVVESEPGTRDVPSTLHDSLMARLDRLGGNAKEVAQFGAVLGRDFDYALIAAMEPLPAPALDAALARLAEAELLYQTGAPPQATYHFKHALVQDAAYGSLLRSRRRELHSRAASILVERFPESVAAQPELTAHHHTAAGEAEQAAAAWRRAGGDALARGFVGEAIGHYRQGLAALATLSESPERDEKELRLQLRLGQALIIAAGFASPEAAAPYARARVLGYGLGDPAQFIGILIGLWTVAMNREGPLAAAGLASEALAASERTALPAAKAWAYFAEGSTRYHSGDLRAAIEHFERSIAYAEEGPFGVPISPLVGALGYACHPLSFVGEIDRALACALRGVELAEQGGRPADRAWAGMHAALLYAHLDDPARARKYSDLAFVACDEEPNEWHAATAAVIRGWAVAAERPGPEALALLRDAIERQRSTGQRLALELFLGVLAEAQVRCGKVDDALATLREAEDARLPGEEFTRAETFTRRADLLAPAYAGFRRGFDVPDLVAARELLTALGGS